MEGDSTQFTTANGSYNCPVQSGLDAGVPYSGTMTNHTVPNYLSNNEADDSPSSDIPPTKTSFSRTFRALQQLAWQSSTPNSIPVVIGTVDWGYTLTQVGVMEY